MIALRRLLVGVLVALAAATLVASPATAHASLLGSTPAPDSVLERPPDVVVLRFSEPVDLVDDSIRVLDASGAAIEVGPVRRDGGDDTVAVDVTSDLDGSYVVAWQVVSADSHAIEGAFTFSVGAPTTTDPSLIDDVLAGTGASGGSTVALGIGRWMSYAGVAVLVGGFAVLSWCAPARLADRRSSRLLAVAAGVGVVGTMVMIAARSAAVAGGALDPGGWSTVVGSRSGRWWLIRLLLLAVAPFLLLALRRSLRRPVVTVGLAAYGLALLAAVAAGGHAVTGAAIPLGFAATVVHLVAMSTWVGGLVTLVVVLDRRDLWRGLARFSPLALGAVVALAITGVVNAWRQLGTPGAITDGGYGRWLIVKLVVVALVVVAAAVSRATLRRGSSAVATAPSLSTVGAAARTRGAPDVLRRSVLLEVVGMAVVLVATVGLVDSPPPKSLAGEEAESITVIATRDDWSAQIDLVPAETGGTTMHVTLSAVAGEEQEADEITVTAALPAQQLGPIEFPMVPAGDNHVTTNDADFPVPGVWEITVTARFGDFDQVAMTTTAEVR